MSEDNIIQYVVDITNPPTPPPIRRIHVPFGETKKSKADRSRWLSYIELYGRELEKNKKCQKK